VQFTVMNQFESVTGASVPAVPAPATPGSPTAAAFTRNRREPDRFRMLLPLLDRHRGDLPLDFLLGWIAVESAGRIDETTTSLDERGFFQIHPKESKSLGLQHQRLTSDPDYSVQSGIRLVHYYAALARQRYPWIPAGSELFWRVVKLQHAMGVRLTKDLLTAIRREGVTPTWEQIKAYEISARGKQLHRLLRHEPGRFGRNVDRVFVRGRRIAAALGR
jgi:hypothetical protein